MGIKVAIIGVGNCACSLLQGLEYYKSVTSEGEYPGLMHPILGGYLPKDILPVAAFDVAVGKVGQDLSEAIWARPNDTLQFSSVPPKGVVVSKGTVHDGIGSYLEGIVREEAGVPACDVVKVLKDSGAEVVVNYLPVGSEVATRWYVERVLEARCALVNCIPVFIASEGYWHRRFQEAGVPVIGDDVKSQVGATIVHRVLSSLFGDRGVRVDRAYQLNVGGNTDFLNMLDRGRLASKKESKTSAVLSATRNEVDSGRDLHVGPSDYVPWLTDRKFAFIRIEGTGFGGALLELDLHLRVWDSPNSAGVVIDAIRLAKLALNAGQGGALVEPSAYLMKSPPVQARDDNQARLDLDRFVEGRRSYFNAAYRYSG